METTEKGMKIVVTRAPRGTKWDDIPMGMYFASMEGKLFLRLSGVDANSVVSIPFGPNQMAHRATMAESREFWERHRFHVFQSFTDAANWVSNGWKLEDLGGDGRDEFKTLAEIPMGTVCKVIDNKGFGRFKWGDVVMVSKEAKGIMSLVDGDSCPFANLNGNLTGIEKIVAWPIDLERGDTITITWG